MDKNSTIVKKIIESGSSYYDFRRSNYRVNYYRYKENKFHKIFRNDIEIKKDSYFLVIHCNIAGNNENENISEFNFIIANNS